MTIAVRGSTARRIPGSLGARRSSLRGCAGRPLHLRRPARRHRHRVRARGCDDARRRLQRARPGALRAPTGGRSSRASTTRATSRRSRALAELHDVSLVVPLADLDHRLLAQQRDAFDALLLLPGPETIALCEDKYAAHRFFDANGIASPPSFATDELPDSLSFPVLVKARRGFGSRHIYRAADARELAFFLGYTTADSIVQQACVGEEFSIDVFCDLDGRCLNAIPRTMIESKGGESIKGMTIDDADLIEHGRRVVGGDGDRRPGEHPVLPRARRLAPGHRRQPALRRRLSGADGRRVALPGARARACGRGAVRSRRLGEFRSGVVMTRFFSQIVLHDAGGVLEPLPAASIGAG